MKAMWSFPAERPEAIEKTEETLLSPQFNFKCSHSEALRFFKKITFYKITLANYSFQN